MSMKTIEITDTNLKGIIEKDGITVLDSGVVHVLLV